MIKLIRGKCPDELTEEVKKELTEVFKHNKGKDVWNSPKVKPFIKEALLKMSHQKCVYCECMLDIESKDVTIDHFLPKSVYADKVVEWENLFPSCLRCNRKKCDNTEKLLNPCEMEPKEYLGIKKKSPYRLKELNHNSMAKNTITVLGLNDIRRVLVPRMQEWEDINERLEDLLEDMEEDGFKPRYQKRVEKLMEKCTAPNAYAAVKATNMLHSDAYIAIKKIMEENIVWTEGMDDLEQQMKQIALKMI